MNLEELIAATEALLAGLKAFVPAPSPTEVDVKESDGTEEKFVQDTATATDATTIPVDPVTV